MYVIRNISVVFFQFYDTTLRRFFGILNATGIFLGGDHTMRISRTPDDEDVTVYSTTFY